MAIEPGRDKSELVLPPNEFAHVQDASKGEIDTYVGPVKVSLSGDNVPMVFDSESKRFKAVSMESCKQTFVTAPAGWYVVLLNPAQRHPKVGSKNSTPDDMKIGKKIVIPGPCSFALWPGQMAEVVQGHRLRSNEYLIIEVYDDEAARDSWTKATVKEATQVSTEKEPLPTGEKATEQTAGEVRPEKDDEKEIQEKAKKEEKTVKALLSSVPSDLANGKRYVIKGTEYAFYIPSSGVKVLNENGKYVRQAVTLEKLEYAILLDENGDKEYSYGPRVVFPEPTQQFVISNKQNKFRAFELDSRKGVYIKVIESYIDSEGKTHAEGEELFISGDGLIYFPRKEHSIIKYGEQEVHYATAIPKGEGRYVLDRISGEVKTISGPKMLLPDPRNAVMTRRILTEREVKLFYPDNTEALAINRMLAENNRDSSPESLAAYLEKTFDQGSSRGGDAVNFRDGGIRKSMLGAEPSFGGDSFERKTSHTKPRTVVLDTKYQGAVPINIWTGYAVKVVNKSGKGHVVVGPDAILLEYDETLEPMQLSTGTPKTTDRLLETAYLKVQGNKVSDQVRAITADLVEVEVMLSYRVNFEGEDLLKWFSIENYVKFLCDHISSVLKSVIKKYKIAELHANSTEIIRDAILNKKPENGDRPGMKFEENNMRVYDVEVFDLTIGDIEVQMLLKNAQQTSIKTTLQISQREQAVNATKTLEKLNQDELMAKRSTEKEKHKADIDRINEGFAQEEASRKNSMAADQAALAHKNQISREQFEHEEKLKREKVLNTERLETEKAKEAQSRLEIATAIDTAQRLIKIANWTAQEDHDAKVVKQLLEANSGRAESAKIIAEAFSPQLIEALNTLRNSELLGNLSENFKDLAILEGKGFMATASRFLDMIPQGLIPKLNSLIPTSEASKKIEEAKEFLEE